MAAPALDAFAIRGAVIAAVTAITPVYVDELDRNGDPIRYLVRIPTKDAKIRTITSMGSGLRSWSEMAEANPEMDFQVTATVAGSQVQTAPLYQCSWGSKNVHLPSGWRERWKDSRKQNDKSENGLCDVGNYGSRLP